MGINFTERTGKNLVVHNEITDIHETYEILYEIPFDSTRKRMSLIVKHKGQIIMMTKGADSVIIPLLDFTSADK